MAVYGELGRYPLYILIITRLLSYWQRLETISREQSSHLLTAALRENKRISNLPKGAKSWFSSVKFLIQDLGFDVNCPENISNYNVDHSLRESFEKKWLSMLLDDSSAFRNGNAKNKLRTYRTFKNVFSSESYLSNITNRSHRTALCKLRISSHDLAIERGRYKNLNVDERVCACNGMTVEDEFHFVMCCPSYNSQRMEFFDWVKNIYKNFSTLDDRNKFIWLMSNEDQDFCQRFGRFISECFEKRIPSSCG